MLPEPLTKLQRAPQQPGLFTPLCCMQACVIAGLLFLAAQRHQRLELTPPPAPASYLPAAPAVLPEPLVLQTGLSQQAAQRLVDEAVSAANAAAHMELGRLQAALASVGKVRQRCGSACACAMQASFTVVPYKHAASLLCVPHTPSSRELPRTLVSAGWHGSSAI